MTDTPRLSAWRSIQCIGAQHHNCRGPEWSCSCPCHLGAAEVASLESAVGAEARPAIGMCSPEHTPVDSNDGAAARQSSVSGKSRQDIGLSGAEQDSVSPPHVDAVDPRRPRST